MTDGLIVRRYVRMVRCLNRCNMVMRACFWLMRSLRCKHGSSPKQCPRCGRGTVRAYQISLTGERVRLCDECEALWAGDKILDVGNFHDFSTYMRQRGGTGLWRELDPADS